MIVDKIVYDIVYLHHNTSESEIVPATARISDTDHARLRRLAQATGKTQQEIIGKALAAYERAHFFALLDAGFAALRDNEQEWREELAERQVWDATMSDKSVGS